MATKAVVAEIQNDKTAAVSGTNTGDGPGVFGEHAISSGGGVKYEQSIEATRDRVGSFVIAVEGGPGSSRFSTHRGVRAPPPSGCTDLS
jgi:hypothetical protein